MVIIDPWLPPRRELSDDGGDRVDDVHRGMKTVLDGLNASLGNSLRELSTSMYSLQEEVADLRKAKETQEARPYSLARCL